jgi:hypothetical protein
MKRFLLYVALFSAMILATLAAGEWLVRRAPNPYRTKAEAVAARGGEVETLILGSSLTYYGVIPSEYGPGTLNLANVSQLYEWDYLLLKRYAALMPRLRLVIIPVSYCSFFDPPFTEADEWWYETYYQLYMGVKRHSWLSRYGSEVANFPVYAGKVRNILQGREGVVSDADGFGLGYTVEARQLNWESTGPATARRQTAPDDRYVSYNLEYLNRLVELCRELGAEPVLVTTPWWHTYRESLEPSQRDRSKALAADVARRYGLRYLDFSADGRFVDEDFYDADHLSDRGALKFTHLLRDTIGQIR